RTLTGKITRLYHQGDASMSFAQSQRLTSAGAKKMAAAAVAKAEEFGISATVAIVDAGGHMIQLERMDNGRFHTVHSSTTKAVCAASNKRPTTTKGAQGQDLDTLHAIGLSLAAGPGRWTAMEGGFPIMIKGECVGGIGVSGGDWKQDEDMALAAINAVGADILS
ncbi:MAG: heme-binding protein, partial [Rhodospirillales bacterium]|nr:heme-binding protein [Rhodospirillales bacterium]